MAWTLDSIWNQTDMGLNSASAIYGQCYLLSLTLNFHLWIYILVKTLQDFPISPSITSKGPSVDPHNAGTADLFDFLLTKL